MFRNAIIQLNYDGYQLSDVIKHLGIPVLEKEQLEAGNIYILLLNKDLMVLTQKGAQEAREKKVGRLFRLTQKEYHALTNAKSKMTIKLKPKVTDTLSRRVSHSFTANGVLLIALFLTIWALPLVNLIFAPLLFFGSAFSLNLIRFYTSFGRWPNQGELSSMITNSLDGTVSISIAMVLYIALTGASLLSPVIIHSISLGTITFGGPVVTYFLAPVLISLIIATGITLYKDAKLIFTHFFDFSFNLHKSFPYFFSIPLRKNRPNTKTLVFSLIKTTLLEFSLNFFTTLATVYLAYIPSGLLIGALIGTGASSGLASSIVDIIGHTAIGISLAIGFTYLSEKVWTLFSYIGMKLKQLKNGIVDQLNIEGKKSKLTSNVTSSINSITGILKGDKNGTTAPPQGTGSLPSDPKSTSLKEGDDISQQVDEKQTRTGDKSTVPNISSITQSQKTPQQVKSFNLLANLSKRDCKPIDEHELTSEENTDRADDKKSQSSPN